MARSGFPVLREHKPRGRQLLGAILAGASALAAALAMRRFVAPKRPKVVTDEGPRDEEPTPMSRQPSPLVARFLSEREGLLADHEGEIVLYLADGRREFGQDEMALFARAQEAGFGRSELFIARVMPRLSPESVPWA